MLWTVRLLNEDQKQNWSSLCRDLLDQAKRTKTSFLRSYQVIRRNYRSKKEDLKDDAKIPADPICSAGQYHKIGVPEMLSGVEEALSSVYKL